MSRPSKEIYLETTVDAGVKEVWKTWTTKKGLESFFAPKVNIEPKLWGKFEILFNPENKPGERGAENNKILSIQPEKFLSFSWDAPPYFPEIRKLRTVVSLTFEPVDEKRTRIIFNQTGWGPGEKWDEVREYFSSAWKNVVFVNLHKRLNEGPINWKKVVSSQK